VHAGVEIGISKISDINSCPCFGDSKALAMSFCIFCIFLRCQEKLFVVRVIVAFPGPPYQRGEIQLGDGPVMVTPKGNRA